MCSLDIPDQETVDRALEYFRAGHNCCQSTLLALAETLKLVPENAIPILSSTALGFGGGIGQSGGICGIATGCVMALGLILERDTGLQDNNLKSAVTLAAGDFLRQFEGNCGSLTCAGITGFRHDTKEGRLRFKRETTKETKCIPAMRKALKIVLDSYCHLAANRNAP
jgi:C_GCAxxG_C_C family probable redox protein